MDNKFFDKSLFGNNDKSTDFSALKLALASPEKIRSWSYGEVRQPETINYRTFKPETDGLFCAKIFGPIKDYECLCGKYKRMKYRNVTCEKCGVEVTVERVRRERMGHINLACPVAHILFFKSLPSRIGLMLDLTMRDIERILYFEAYIVLDPKRLPDLERGRLLNADEYQKLREEHGLTSFDAGIGAEGLRDFLKKIDLEGEIEQLGNEMEEANSETKRKKIFKRLKLMKNFHAANLRPEWMILEALPVLPPNLRPLVQLDGIRFTTSDLNELYRRVINRNDRLRKLLELEAPEILINNEKRMLQEAVDSLLDNGRRGKPAMSSAKQPLKSLADIVKGKTGRFRQNLLGKRVDFSARSVIVVGPSLRLHECGLPKHMALNLFRPFLFNALIRKGYASNIKQAKQRADEPDAEVWDALEDVIRQHPIMLNRAPTLHRLGIQAFEPVLIEGKAIQLHPLVCVAFNADFDGDQMAVHVPLSLEAQAEARVLMLSSNNILSPANGEPIILPTQDTVFGIYYATRERVGAKGEGMRFVDLNEMSTALASGAVDLQAKISVLMPAARIAGHTYDAPEEVDDDEERIEEKTLVETTVGRALMLFFLPPKLPFSLVNRTLKKKDLPIIVTESFHVCGLRDTVIFCDNLMRFGFERATRSGLSICMDDMAVPARKAEIVARTEEEIKNANKQFRGGLLTHDECYNKSVDLWDKAGEEISRIMMDELAYEPSADGKSSTESFNSLYMMADSGARGSQTQIKQLAGMRGLMTRSDGRIMETAITANFREGLSVLQYFLSAQGGRKGLTDTALKTASSGYLTRRLVDVAQDVVVGEEDCGTEEGVILRTVLMGSEVVVPLSNRVLGRFLATDVSYPQSGGKKTGELLYAAGTYMGEKEAAVIAETGVDEVVVRSPVKCRLPHGLCIKCYGRDLGRGCVIQLGEAVGVIAAQSIGEPGTQLTMRTFHIGGAAKASMGVDAVVEAKTNGRVKINARHIANSRGERIIVSRGGEVSVRDADGRGRERYLLQYGDVLKFDEDAAVKAGATIFTRDSLREPIITEHSGTVAVERIKEGINAKRQDDELTGIEKWEIIEDVSAGASKGGKSSGKRKRVACPSPECKHVFTADEKEKQESAEKWKCAKCKNEFGKEGGPRVKFLDDKGKPVKIPGTDTNASISLSVGMTLEVMAGGSVGAGDVIATRPRKLRKSRDITGGLPRVAELFEAREPKEPSLLASASGRVVLMDKVRSKQILAIVNDAGERETHRFQEERGRKVMNKENELVRAKIGDVIYTEKGIVSRAAGILSVNINKGKKKGTKEIVVIPMAKDEKKETWTVKEDREVLFNDGDEVVADDIIVNELNERVAKVEGLLTTHKDEKSGEVVVEITPASFHEIPRGRSILVQNGVRVKRGEEIVDGDVNPHEILAMRGIEALTEHIVEEVQSVYRLQGVTINDKHIEVIVHQMLRCVVVTKAGESRYLTDDRLVLSEALEENEKLAADDKKPLEYRNILLGITKASLATDSFISAASFQETTRVLTEAAVAGKRDKLRGLKENVIVGRLIPAGTGFVHYAKLAAGGASVEDAMDEIREGLTDVESEMGAPASPDSEMLAQAQPDDATAAEAQPDDGVTAA